MEIISQNTAWFPFVAAIAFVIFAAIVTLLLFLGGVISLITDGFSASDLVATLVFGAFAAVMILTIVGGFNAGPETYYKAIVTDYNAVYDAGYIVESVEGKIVTLTKE